MGGEGGMKGVFVDVVEDVVRVPLAVPSSSALQ